MSNSKSASATTTNNRDGRVAGDNGAIGISAEGDVDVHIVADEAFEMGKEALAEMRELASGVIVSAHEGTEIVGDTLSKALFATQDAAKTEAGQISEQLIKIAIPAAAIAFVAARVLK